MAGLCRTWNLVSGRLTDDKVVDGLSHHEGRKSGNEVLRHLIRIVRQQGGPESRRGPPIDAVGNFHRVACTWRLDGDNDGNRRRIVASQTGHKTRGRRGIRCPVPESHSVMYGAHHSQ